MKNKKKILMVVSMMVVLLFATSAVFIWAFGVDGSEITELTAQLSELVGEVEAKTNPDAPAEQAFDGMQLEPGGQVSTGDDGRARVDLSNGTIIRVAENTSFEMDQLELTEEGALTRVKVSLGELWVILAGGSLEADTPSGTASVRGSYMSVSIDHGETFVTCLEGNCEMETEGGKLEMIAGDTASVTDLTLLPEHGFMTGEMIRYWLEINPEATRIVPAVTATVRASLPEVVLPDLNCLYEGSCVDYCLPGNWDLNTGQIPALNQIPNDCVEGLLSFVWQGVNPETVFVCLAIGGSPQACANNSVRRVFPVDLKAGEKTEVELPDLACTSAAECASYCVPQGWDPNSGQAPSLFDIPLDCLAAATSLLAQDVDPWLFMQCVYVYGDLEGCAEAAVEK
jgi:hypothetical protein